MSERGSFVTEYIHCDKCLDAVRDILVDDVKYLKGIEIPMWGGGNGNLPIIAGKLGGGYGGEEADYFELELAPRIAAKICHPVRVVVLCDSGLTRLFRVSPSWVELEGFGRVEWNALMTQEQTPASASAAAV